MSVQYPIDPVLVERFAHGNGTVFVGAGMSLGSRLPSWYELMEPLRLDLGKEIAASADYLQIAELYETKHNRSVLVQYLKDRLGDVRFQLTKAHELIVGLPVKRIYTTNFDTLLEQASQKKQINRNVIVNASQVGFSNHSVLSIVKLHGDLGDPDSIVITSRDFHGYFARNPSVADLLKVELQTHTILFLGYSFSDPNLGMILGSAAAQSGSSGPLLYSLQFKPSELAMQSLKSRGIKVIALNADPRTPEADEAIEDWLRSFRQSLVSFERRKYRSGQENSQPRSSKLPQLRKNAIRRMKMSERIKTGLQSDFRVVVVKGEAGIGKTQLVAEAAADCLQSSMALMSGDAFERTIWIKSSFDVKPTGHTLKGILDSIASNVDTLLISEGSEDIKKQRTEINVILQERRLLIVIEDFEEPPNDHSEKGREALRNFVEIKEWLENSGPYANPMSRIIVTSRSAIVAGFVVEISKLDKEESLELMHDHARVIMLRHRCPTFDKAFEKKLLAKTAGNPQAIKLALGLCNGTGMPMIPELLDLNMQKIDKVFKILVDDILNELRGEPKSALAVHIVIAMTVFPTEEWVPESLLKEAVGDTILVDKALSFTELAEYCVRFGLLERNACTDCYLMPRIIREILREDQENAGWVRDARERLAAHLLAFLNRSICRPGIEKYWNAMVCDEMAKVDRYWPIIDVIMYYPDGGERAVDFALLMVHYMDSRFLNNQRLKFIELALKVPDIIKEKHTEALLRIDGLAWTYMEEGANQKALKEIDTGLKLLKNADCRDANDLKALAHA